MIWARMLAYITGTVSAAQAAAELARVACLEVRAAVVVMVLR